MSAVKTADRRRQRRPGRVRVSFEFFPPKTEQMAQALWAAVTRLAPLNPEFVSVTYGAGGSTRERTHETVARLVGETRLKPAAHLTCVGASRDEVDAVARAYWAVGVRHVVALRGDPPEGQGTYVPHPHGYPYAADLVAGLRRIADFEISVAAYPEGHPQSPSLAADIDNLKRKIDAGATRAISQYFFDVDVFRRFRDRLAKAGVAIQWFPGILPVTNFAQVVKFRRLRGHRARTDAPGFRGPGRRPETRRMVAAVQACRQVEALAADGIHDFHFYTLNRADLTLRSATCWGCGRGDEKRTATVAGSGRGRPSENLARRNATSGKGTEYGFDDDAGGAFPVAGLVRKRRSALRGVRRRRRRRSAVRENSPSLRPGLDARLGAAVLDTETGRRGLQGGRAIPAQQHLQAYACAGFSPARRCRGGGLERRMVVRPDAVVSYSPVAGKRTGGEGRPLPTLQCCVTLSDNTAGTLVLDVLGGPEGFTAFMRRIGDPETRLDRREPDLNEAKPGDSRDTTTPTAAVNSLQALVAGPMLSEDSRRLLEAWLADDWVADRCCVPISGRMADRRQPVPAATVRVPSSPDPAARTETGFAAIYLPGPQPPWTNGTRPSRKSVPLWQLWSSADALAAVPENRREVGSRSARSLNHKIKVRPNA